MIKFKAKEQAKVTPRREAADQLLQDLKRTLEIEAGRGNITVNHFLTSRGSEDPNASAPQSTPGSGFYTLEGVIATGGMGAVLKAKDNNLARTVALKVMLNSANANEHTVFNFVAEAQITGQLEHPNIVPLHDIGVASDGTIYYTMKLIEGRTLRDILKDIREGNAETIQGFPISRLLTIFQKVCDGMSYAHSRGVIHRDLKPDNVMIGEFGEVLILDWGIAKVLPEPGQAHTEEADEEFSGPLAGDGADASATMAGQLKGTPNYMAPEQAEGRVADIDTRSDIYALGGILYYTLTMQPPITGTNLNEILTRVTSGNIHSPSSFNSKPTENPSGKIAPHCPNGLIPEALSAVAMKCMARESALRYQTVEELQADLAAYQGGYATRAQDANPFTLIKLLFQRNKKEVVMAGIALLAILAVIGLFIGRLAKSKGLADEARKKAETFVLKLQETAPSFATVAEGKLRELKFGEAMTNVLQAISLNKSNGSFHIIKGNIHMSLLEIHEARESFEKARQFDARLPDAIRSSRICASIIRDNKDIKKLSDKSKRDIYELFREQGRVEEAGRIFAMVAATDSQMLVTFRRQLTAAQIKSELLERDDLGQYHLNLSENPVTSLTALRNLPLTTLNLAGSTNLTDLDPLKGMSLTSLNLSRMRRLTDLGPLARMPLTQLNLKDCDELLDLGPLAGLPLTRLDISDTKIVDLKPLIGIKLEWLDASRTPTRDLTALAGMPLRSLNIESTKVINLDPLRGAPLQFLNFSSNTVSQLSALTKMPLVTNIMRKTIVRDISALKGMRLQHLDCSKTPVENLAPLAGMNSLRLLDLRETGITTIAPLAGLPLDVLKLALTQISDIGALRGAPLTVELDLSETRVSSLDALRGAPLQYLNLSRSPIASVAPLAGMPLKVLRMDSLPTQPDLSPLWECQGLEQLAVPFPSPTVVALRQLPKLKRLDFFVPEDAWTRSKTPVVFWKDWDARNQ